jgi:hypothetical protein
MRNTYARYVNEEPSVNTSTNENGSSSRQYFKKHLKHASLVAGSHVCDILEDYLSSAEEDCHALDFWNVQSTDARYAGLARMARDNLVVQATSVPQRAGIFIGQTHDFTDA